MADPASYTVGWICALPVEYIAAQEFLDEEHGRPKFVSPNDSNDYTLGKMCGHNVVMAVLPDGDYGTASAATTATNMLSTFQNVRIGLMVGIGGGVPSQRHDIRLGDVVVSASRGEFGGVFQYNFGKSIQDQEFQHTRFLNQPPAVLRTAIAGIRTQYERSGHMLDEAIDNVLVKNKRLRRKYKRPSPDTDKLFKSEMVHKSICGDGSCMDNASCCVSRKERIEDEEDNPAIHYGLIASGNQLMKDAMIRDKFAAMKDVLCFEMEAAGLMNTFPCLVIRGICDYSDSHKNDEWHGYAAMVAAGYAKDLLERIPLNQIEAEERIGAILSDKLETTNELLQQSQHQTEQYHRENISNAWTKEQLRCHQAFKTSNYEEQKNINPERVQGTCQWALQSFEFTRWWETSFSDLLWISADPGCGKSVLARSIIDEFIPESGHEVVSCYFFFKDNDLQNGLATALCALLHQLFSQRPDLLCHAIPSWETSGEKIHLEVDELWRILLNAALAGNCKVVCVLDALDECRENDQNQLITRLNQYYLERQLSPDESCLKFLVTSRPYDHIYEQFLSVIESLPNLRLRGEEENDQIHQEIDLVVKVRVEELAKAAALSDHIQQRLEKQLLRMEHRTYLWLHLAMDDIRTTFKNSLRPADESIQLIPQSVNAAYKKILCRVPSDKVAEVQKILQIIFAARRPLTVQEMTMALGIATRPQSRVTTDAIINSNGFDTKLRRLCGLFVFINNSKVYLIHQTAREFLMQQASLYNLGLAYSFSPHGPEMLMADLCVRYLLMEDLNCDVSELDSHARTLLEYSATNWPDHVRSTSMDLNVLLLDSVLRLYDTSALRFRLWYPIFWVNVNKPAMAKEIEKQIDRTHWKLGCIQLAAFNGHFRVFKRLFLEEKGEVVQTSQSMIPALAWASWKGNEEICRLLLEHGADPNQHSEIEYGYPLAIAANMKHLRVVNVLLEKGADPNLTCPRSCSCVLTLSTSALQLACNNGDLEVARSLLVNGANVNYFGAKHGSAIQAASARGHVELVQLLLDNGAVLKGSGWGEYLSPLHVACHKGHSEIVQLLLQAGADSVYDDKDHVTALCEAARSNHLEVVRLLVQQVVEVNIFKGNWRGNPLEQASRNGNVEIVRFLLESGADPNCNALAYAAQHGDPEVLRVLLEAGANIDIGSKEQDPTPRWGTAMIAAASCGNAEVVSMFLNLGANINAEDKHGKSALWFACLEGHQKIVHILLDRGADLSTQGESSLLAACSEGHLKIVHILVDRGVDLSACGKDAILNACRRGHHKIVRILIDRGVDLSAYSEDLIQTACIEGCYEIVLILLHQGAGINAQGDAYRNSLQAACERGYVNIAVALLDQGAEMNFQGPRGDALQGACYNGYEQLAGILLDRGADVNSQAGPCGNALQVACYMGNEQLSKILIDRGADVNAQGGPYGNTLQVACFFGNERLAETLLGRGADVNAEGPYGNALHAACHNGKQQLAKVLLDRGANMSAQGPYGDALQNSCYRGYDKLAETLLDRGADVNAQGGPYGNALDVACLKKNEAITEILLDRGADVNAQGGYFGDFLCAVYARGYREVAQIAFDRGYQKIAQTILDQGASKCQHLG